MLTSKSAEFLVDYRALGVAIRQRSPKLVETCRHFVATYPRHSPSYEKQMQTLELAEHRAICQAIVEMLHEEFKAQESNNKQAQLSSLLLICRQVCWLGELWVNGVAIRCYSLLLKEELTLCVGANEENNIISLTELGIVPVLLEIGAKYGEDEEVTAGVCACIRNLSNTGERVKCRKRISSECYHNGEIVRRNAAEDVGWERHEDSQIGL